MSSLVKFTTDESLDLELAVIRKSRPSCNTNAAAAKYAINHYLSECEEHTRTRKALESALIRLAEAESILFAQDELKTRTNEYLATMYPSK